MTHTRAFRALATVVTVWLGICLAQPMQLQLCVMHGGSLAIESGSHSAGHMSHSAGHDAHHPAPGHEKSQQCSCLGDCTSGSTPAFVAAPPVRIETPVDTRVVASAVAEYVPVSAAALLLPYSNGPPTASSLA